MNPEMEMAFPLHGSAEAGAGKVSVNQIWASRALMRGKASLLLSTLETLHQGWAAEKRKNQSELLMDSTQSRK